MGEMPLRSGYTTGTCAAAAAKAAAMMLLLGKTVGKSRLRLPNGEEAEFTVLEADIGKSSVSCCVRKDAGDDPDVTDGALVYARVSYIEHGEPVQKDWYTGGQWENLYLTGGRGIGRVTRPGLSCPIGMAAINPVPRRMIFASAGQVLEPEACEAGRRFLITIEIPDGERLAEKTFNPKLGIQGGISVLGTSGIVMPMSEQALLDTIRLEIHMKAVEGEKLLILTPGNYGQEFLQDTMKISLDRAVKCSNYIADAVEMAAQEQFSELLYVGHIGKLIKVAAGMRNTHSKYGDRRMETILSCMRELTEDWTWEFESRIRNSNTTDEAIGWLTDTGRLDAVMQIAAVRVQRQLEQWSDGKLRAQVVMFSREYGILGNTIETDQIKE